MPRAIPKPSFNLTDTTLKIILTFILFFVTTLIGWSQVTITGKVIFKEDKLSAPGVNIVEKGTRNGTTSDINGEFEIGVSDQNAILIFSYIGAVTQEYHLDGKREITVEIKQDCIKDFFDAYHIDVYANSGLIHNPIGGQIEISSPYTSIGVIKGSYSYQTNLGDNKFQTGNIEIAHPISNCDFDMDFRWSHRNVSFNNVFQSTANSGEAQLNLDNISLIAGYSHLDISTIAEDGTNTSSGVIIGLGKEVFFRPIFGTFSTKVAIYKSNVEYQAEFKSGYRWLQCFIRYYKLESFDELSLGVGFQIGYYRNKR